MQKPFTDCPRFNKCSVNKCPLDPDYDTMKTHPDDPERKCRLSKNRRIAIAENYPGVLVYGGMTGREYAATVRMSDPAVREAAKSRLAAHFYTGVNVKQDSEKNRV